jgi:site-specific DNA-methyltransferase (adenine-specific)
MEFSDYETFGSKGTIIKGDCLNVMRDIDKSEITLCFTSPPYLNAVNYDEHTQNLDNDEKWEREDINYDEYRDFLTERFEELFRITEPGGYNVVNIAPVSWNGDRVALPFHFVSWMEEIGWEFQEDIVWEKPVAKDRRSGVLMQHPYPGYYYPSLVTEYIFVFQKPAESDSKQNIYHDKSQEQKEENEIDLSDYQGEQSKNAWKIRPTAPQETDHPCPFPVELAERVIKFYSYKGDKVVDIFAGSGSCLVAAKRRDREYIGMETQQEYINQSLNRLKQT